MARFLVKDLNFFHFFLLFPLKSHLTPLFIGHREANIIIFVCEQGLKPDSPSPHRGYSKTKIEIYSEIA
ncbi:hypothetical protein CTT30_03470 [Vibrio coralliilyticus]|nr:hypothetical protein CTT30_03470 [Vibrio coralliilyticus]